jgi:hypothetical protein
LKRFVVYDPQTGKILRYGTCQDDTFALQKNDGELVMEGVITNETHVIDGVPVYVPPPEPTEEEKATKAAAEEQVAHLMRVRGRLPELVLDFENRLRAIEKKDPLSKADFMASLKGMK